MKSIYKMLAVVAVAAGMASAAPAAFSQDDKTVAADDEIIVSPYQIQRERVERNHGGFGVEALTLSRVVTAEGLDLRYDADVRELFHRVNYTARQVCQDLDDATNGASLTSDRECVRDAIRGARPQVEAVVADARSEP